MTRYARIAGWGKYIPENIVTNEEIARILNTSDGWITERTGISERRFAGREETTASMASAAARQALERAGVSPEAVDLIVVATVSPDHLFPSTACLVQRAIGAERAAAYDLSAACAGFIYALSMGTAMIQTGAARIVLVIGSETLSRFIDIQDRTTYPFFGDGAGAVILQASETPGGALGTVLGADGTGADLLCMPAGGSKLPPSKETVEQRLHYVKMNGREVSRSALNVIRGLISQVCEKIGLDLDDIDLYIPHQSNLRIIRSACRYLGIPEDKVFINIDKYANTSSASLPIALCEAAEQGRLQAGDKVLMVGFGGGLTWGATVFEWTAPVSRIPDPAKDWVEEFIRA